MSKNTRITCPECQASHTLRLNVTGRFVCPQCGTQAVVNDIVQPREGLRTSAPMPDDLSFVQLGTTGVLDGTPFEIIGRMRLQLRNDYKNFWCAVHQNGSGFWIAESFGSFAIYNGAWQPYNDNPAKLRSNQIIPLTEGDITGEYVERCEALSFRGELLPWDAVEPGWFVVQAGSKDMRSAFFVTKAYVKRIEYLLGRKVPVENLKLANTLAWNEWN
jgi:hypothetical protein